MNSSRIFKKDKKDSNKKSEFGTTAATVGVKIKESKVPGAVKDLSSGIPKLVATISDITFSKLSDTYEVISIYIYMGMIMNIRICYMLLGERTKY